VASFISFESSLERRCLKWVLIVHSDIWNTSYGQKKCRESNCQFDSRPEKVRNWLDLLGFKQHVTYRWKALNESYNFALNCTSIWGLVTKLWGSKVIIVLIGAISGLLGKKSHLEVWSVATTKHTIRGEGGGFPQVRVVVSLVCPCCPWLVLTPRVFQLCTNHLVWVVCKLVWVSEACQLFLVPSRSSNTPFYPSKCCELGSVPPIPPSFAVFYLDPHLGPLRSWECITFHELHESRFCEGIGRELSREQRDEEWRRIYDVGWRKQKRGGGILVKKGS
jgi:hypothetical protein